MNNLVQTIITALICVVLSVVLGYLLATPDTFQTIGFVGFILAGLCLPLAIKWHYPVLLFSWSASVAVFFLPGQTQLWMLMAVVSLFMSVMAYTLNRNTQFQIVPSVTWTLLILLLVVLATAILRTGIGLRAFGGGTMGGRYYFYILFAACGYFALSCKKIPVERSNRYLSFFLLGIVTAAFSNIIYFAGENFYWLYLIFPLVNAMSQITSDFAGSEMIRLTGFTFASQGLFSWMLARYGVRGLFDITRPWRALVMLLVITLGLLGGFRGILIFFFLTFIIQFYLEGLLRSRYSFALLAVFILSCAILLPFVPKMPLSVQRALSFLPVEIDPSVQMNAIASTEWRLRMWQALLPEIPRYLLLGKGYAINENDLYLAEEAYKRGLAQEFEVSMLAGDYHSGPLSLLISFGLPGLIAFVAFGIAALRVLHKNYKFSDPALRRINVFLYAAFLARFIVFWTIYGAFATDLSIFVGLVGFSVAVNGGVRNMVQSKTVISRPASIAVTA